MKEYKQYLWCCGCKMESPPSELVLLLTKHYPPKKTDNKFTSYIRNLDICSGEFLANFASGLCNRMRWRGLSNGLPKWIGYPFADWGEIGAFDALLVDSVDYSIVKKITRLSSKLKKHENIDYLVYNNIKFFLHGKQRHCDPIGYAVGINTQVAVQQAVQQGVFIAQKLNNRGKVYNETILTVSANTSSEEPCNEDALKIALAKTKWLQMQLKLVEMRKPVQAELCQVICQLAEQADITSFKFGYLAKIIKDEVRLKWQSLNLALECDEFNQIFKQLNNIAEPLKSDTTDEQWESWQNLIKQINNDIDHMNCHSKVRQRIFEEFQLIVNLIGENQDPPSQAQLAKYLKIPKNTLNQDMKRLRQLLLQRPDRFLKPVRSNTRH
jgi:hypothetical protein